MRQGPEYGMHVGFWDQVSPHIYVPLELVDEWQQYKTVVWRDNRDGTYTLIPREDY